MFFKELHRQAIWGATTSQPKSQLFVLMSTQTNSPGINVVASVMGDTLYLSYFIEQCDWLNFGQISTLSRQDYLWETHCLECFFDFGQDNYVEVNFSPKGYFNLYQFENYRTPKNLPPVWADGMVFVTDDIAYDHYIYHLGVKLGDRRTLPIKRINPTAILYYDDTPIYYATRHATPPDFHDKMFWQTMNA